MNRICIFPSFPEFYHSQGGEDKKFEYKFFPTLPLIKGTKVTITQTLIDCHCPITVFLTTAKRQRAQEKETGFELSRP